jgi:hypothetical protein
MQVSMEGCGVGIVDTSAFDPAEPSGQYMLDLKDVYSVRVLLSLIHLDLQVVASVVYQADVCVL